MKIDDSVPEHDQLQGTKRGFRMDEKMKGKLRGGVDAIDILRAAQKCRGEVIFRTGEGDILNLKSTLSSYVFSVALGTPEIAEKGTIEYSVREDLTILREFLQT